MSSITCPSREADGSALTRNSGGHVCGRADAAPQNAQTADRPFGGNIRNAAIWKGARSLRGEPCPQQVSRQPDSAEPSPIGHHRIQGQLLPLLHPPEFKAKPPAKANTTARLALHGTLGHGLPRKPDLLLEHTLLALNASSQADSPRLCVVQTEEGDQRLEGRASAKAAGRSATIRHAGIPLFALDPSWPRSSQPTCHATKLLGRTPDPMGTAPTHFEA